MARTANRGTMSASSPTSYNVMRWRLGKYIRLSKEDLLRGRDESNSVVNQRRLLEQYHQAHLDEFYEGAEADVYVDDGKTGTGGKKGNHSTGKITGHISVVFGRGSGDG